MWAMIESSRSLGRLVWYFSVTEFGQQDIFKRVDSGKPPVVNALQGTVNDGGLLREGL